MRKKQNKRGKTSRFREPKPKPKQKRWQPSYLIVWQVWNRVLFNTDVWRLVARRWVWDQSVALSIILINLRIIITHILANESPNFWSFCHHLVETRLVMVCWKWIFQMVCGSVFPLFLINYFQLPVSFVLQRHALEPSIDATKGINLI